MPPCSALSSLCCADPGLAAHRRHQRGVVYLQRHLVGLLFLVYHPAAAPHVWPLCVILLLAGLTALYFYPEGLLAFVLPLWITLPVASWIRNDGLNLHFVVIWSVFTLILICGRFILLSWFDEAWRRNQQNQLLISRLDALAHQDPLTKTANRRKMEVVLENAVEQKKPSR
jgi:hypothetical protein